MILDDAPVSFAPSEQPLTPEVRAEIAQLARRQDAASGVLMKLITLVGTRVETGLRTLPAPAQERLQNGATLALRQSYHLAARSRSHEQLRRVLTGDRAHRLAASFTGAIGGLGGVPTALAELPVATTMIFRAVQGVAEANGEDPTSAETRLECLQVFGAGGTDPSDDGIDTSFLGARLGLTGATLQGVIGRVAPRFAAVLSQKLASSAVPLLGALAGAGTNYAFVRYYTEIAHVHFGLRRLGRLHGTEPVLDLFHQELARLGMPKLFR